MRHGARARGRSSDLTDRLSSRLRGGLKRKWRHDKAILLGVWAGLFVPGESSSRARWEFSTGAGDQLQPPSTLPAARHPALLPWGQSSRSLLTAKITNPALEMMSFEDVKVTFTREEWQHLSDAQRSLYKTVMLETYCHLLSVGHCIAKPELIVKLEQGAEPWTGQEPPTHSHSGHCTTKPERIKLEQGAEPWTGQEPPTHSLSDYDGQSDSSGMHQWVDPALHNENVHCGRNDLGRGLDQRSAGWRVHSKCQDELLACGPQGSNVSNRLLLFGPQRAHRPEQTFPWKVSSETLGDPSTPTDHQTARTVNIPEGYLPNSGQWATSIGWESHSRQQCEPTLPLRTGVSAHETTRKSLKPNENRGQKQKPHRKSHPSEQLRAPAAEKPFQCQECLKTFKWNSNLELHLKSHTGERPFGCTECPKSFSQLSALKVHLKTHTGEKPYECQECHKTFRQHSSLKLHLITHTGERPYACEKCNKTFCWRTSLKIHLKTHTGERPYECRECQKAFSCKSSLEKHLKTHTGERPYECKECHKKFGWQSSVKVHQKMHSGERPFKCRECPKAFYLNAYLQAHLKTHVRADYVKKHLP